MSWISAEDALLMLAKWSQERTAIQVVMSPAIRIGGQRAAAAGSVERVLPHSKKALLTLRDENGEDVGMTVSLEGRRTTSATAAPTSPSTPWTPTP